MHKYKVIDKTDTKFANHEEIIGYINKRIKTRKTNCVVWFLCANGSDIYFRRE